MRIAFVSLDREPFDWSAATLRVGSAPGNELCLPQMGVAPHHARIVQDSRGWVLTVIPGSPRVYVNARPVRERALLRAGDTLQLGDCQLLLCADASPSSRTLPKSSFEASRQAALRVLAGPFSGRVLPIGECLRLGADGAFPVELPQAASASLSLVRRAGQWSLTCSSTAAARYPWRVNGHEVTEAVVQDGDQIGVAHHRFLVIAPVLARPVVAATPSGPSPGCAPGKAVAPPSREYGWLLMTATLLAFGIALLLSFHS